MFFQRWICIGICYVWVSSVQKSVFSGQSQARRRQHSAIHAALERLHETVELFHAPLLPASASSASSSSTLQLSAETVAICRAHWTRTLLTPAVDLLLNSQALHMQLLGRGRSLTSSTSSSSSSSASSSSESAAVSAEAEATQQLLQPLSADERATIARELRGPLADKMAPDRKSVV